MAVYLLYLYLILFVFAQFFAVLASLNFQRIELFGQVFNGAFARAQLLLVRASTGGQIGLAWGGRYWFSHGYGYFFDRIVDSCVRNWYRRGRHCFLRCICLQIGRARARQHTFSRGYCLFDRSFVSWRSSCWRGWCSRSNRRMSRSVRCRRYWCINARCSGLSRRRT